MGETPDPLKSIKCLSFFWDDQKSYPPRLKMVGKSGSMIAVFFLKLSFLMWQVLMMNRFARRKQLKRKLNRKTRTTTATWHQSDQSVAVLWIILFLVLVQLQIFLNCKVISHAYCNFFEAIILGIASFEEPGVVSHAFFADEMRGMGSRSARHTLIAVTGLVFCTLAPLITVLCFINGSLAAQVLVVNSDCPHSWKPQTNGRPSEVLCSDLRFFSWMCLDRNLTWEVWKQKKHFEHISADHGEVSLFVLLPLCGPDWFVIFCSGSFSGRKMEKKTNCRSLCFVSLWISLTERTILFRCVF